MYNAGEKPCYKRIRKGDIKVAQWHNGYSVGLAINRSRVQILLEATLPNNLGQVVHTRAAITKQYNLVPAKGR